MLNKYILLITLCLGNLWFTGNVSAQNITPDISQIKFLYDELRFEETIKFGQHVLNTENINSQQHLEYLHQYMAYAFYNLGELDSARVHFLSILSINQEIELNPVITSPKIIDFFKETKTNFQQINGNSNYITYPKYVFIEDKRPDAAWRSAILPGWGQYYKMKPRRAYIFGGAFLSSALILGISIINENNYKNSYLGSTDPDDITRHYDNYNNWSKIRKVAAYSTFGIWLLSFADAIWSDYPKLEFNFADSELNTFILSVNYSF